VPARGARSRRHRHRAGPHRRKGPLHALRRALRALCGDRNAAQLAAVEDDLLPGILKTARLGYDGKGQQRVKTRAELVDAWQATGCVPCVLEKMLPLGVECSVIVARGRDGRSCTFRRSATCTATASWP
jgi:phosphoribosylaminoimidazole carboxylase (NCAIR synthetase)